MRIPNEKELALWENTRDILTRWKGAPPKEKELCDAVNPEHRGEYYDLIQAWLSEGRLALSSKEGIGLPSQFGYVGGRVQRNARGFAFLVQPDDEEDFFISPTNLGAAMHGDIVLAQPQGRAREGMRKECKVVKVLTRARTHVVGTYKADFRGSGCVISDDTRLGAVVFIPAREAGGAKDGMKVVAEITRYPDGKRDDCAGRITEVLGEAGDKGVDITAIVRAMEIRDVFPPQVLEEADRLAQQVLAEQLQGRTDWRGIPTVTIDGDDSKDFDDAVSLQALDNGLLRLGVHIADVSEYVRRGSALDREAFERGTSVYLLDRVIPMLPEALSNGICSLNPQVDRLALTCVMDLNDQGDVVDFKVEESVIRSTQRMTYHDVNRILEENDAGLCEKYAPLVPMFRQMEQAAQWLQGRRKRRGALELDIPEPQIVLDEQGHAVDVVIHERGVSNRMIEEFMLVANETVAGWLDGMGIPAVYRVHEQPDPEKMQDLDAFVQPFGYRIKGLNKGVTPKNLQQLLERMEGQSCAAVVNRVMLRSLQKARYAPQNLGHFGLAATDYCHFTSPIRRYPDLTVHRSVKAVLRGMADGRWVEEAAASMPAIALESSEKEAAAVKAEREVDDLKMAEYMSAHVGEHFEGVISGVTEFGIFVELPNTVEGLVRLATMEDDYYDFNEKAYALIGRRTGKQYHLGDTVKVIVAKADVVSRQIDFAMEKGARTAAGR